MRKVVVSTLNQLITAVLHKRNTIGKRGCQLQNYRKLSKINLKKGQDVDQYYVILNISVGNTPKLYDAITNLTK